MVNAALIMENLLEAREVPVPVASSDTDLLELLTMTCLPDADTEQFYPGHTIVQ